MVSLKRRWRLVAGWALAVILGPSSVWAGEPSVSEVVVAASRLDQTAVRSSADADVVVPGDAPPGATLGELLNTISDIQVQRPGGSAGVASVFVRGAKPNFTLVMVEGVPLNDQTNSRGGSTDVSGLDLLDVERVEVVRGALSSLYGSGAIQGAINVILPGGAPKASAAVALEGGTDGDASGALSARAPLAGGAGGSVGVSWDDAGHAIEKSSRTVEALDAKLAPLDGSDRYGLVLRLSRSDAAAFPDDSGGPRLALLRAVEHTRMEQALLGAHWRFQLAPSLSLELNGAGTHSVLSDNSPGVAPGPGEPSGVPSGTSRDEYGFARAQAILRFDPKRSWRALLGVEAQQETGRDQSLLKLFGLSFPGRYTLNRTTPAAFAEADAGRGPFTVDASVRVDRPGDLGAHVSGRVGAAYRVNSVLSLNADVGESFKAPSFYALGNAFVGNPNLRPETADTAEAGFELAAASGLGLKADVFVTQYHQLIDFVAGPPPRLVNRSSVLTQGVQATLKVPVTQRGALRLSATYADTHDQTDGSRLMALPPWRATAAFDWRLSPTVRGRLDDLYVGDRLDTAAPTGMRTLAPYNTVNGRLFIDLTRDSRLELSLENLLNARYEDAIGFPSPGIVGRVSLKHRF